MPRVAVDPARVPTAVLAEIATAVLDADGELGFNVRRLGQPLDASDVFGVVHSVPGVVGVVSFALGGVASTSRLERRPAARHELVLVADHPMLTSVDP